MCEQTRISAYMLICMHMYIYVYICLYVCIYTYMFICVYIQIVLFVIYIYILIYVGYYSIKTACDTTFKILPLTKPFIVPFYLTFSPR